MCVWVGWGLESRPVMDAWECGYDVTNCGRDWDGQASWFLLCNFFYFFLFFLPSTSLWGVYLETFIHHPYTIFLLLTHSHVFVWFFSHMYILHYASSPWLQCVQFLFLSFSQLNISEPELIFKYLGQWKEGVSFVCLCILIHIFAINITWYSF